VTGRLLAGYSDPFPFFSVFRCRSPVEGEILHSALSPWTPCLRGANDLAYIVWSIETPPVPFPVPFPDPSP